MSVGSPFDDKEQVRQAIDIVDLVGSHVQLHRKGRIYVGLCPWHDDTRPSLQVNPERQSFKCWVCDIGGDIFSFVMKVEGVTFPEALQMLADRAGVQLRRSRSSAPGGPEGPPGTPADKRTLYQAMAWAEGQYHDCLLNSPEGEPARKYLDQRGITPQSIERFHLGFSPNQRDWILRRVEGAANRVKILETIGLLARPPEGGSLYDRFRGRLLFSIRDAQGRPVGMGGRVLPEGGSTSPAKYVNTPETPLFSKSNLLYGLDVAREAIRRTGTAVVVEGYTDCIVAHQHGFDNAVAVLGTALGEGHIRILKRFADRAVLVLDADEAGQRRANEVLELFIAQQVDLQVLTLPEDTDPCDFLQQHGPDALTELLEEKAVDALDHAFEAATRGVDLERDVHGSSRALESLISILARAPRLRPDTAREDRLREEKILQRLAARFRVDEQQVRRRVTLLRRRSRPRPPLARAEDAADARAASDSPEKAEAWELGLLELLVCHPELVPAAGEEIPPDRMASESCREIYRTCCRLSEAGITPAFDRLMLELDQPELKTLLVELDEGGRAKGRQDADPKALLQQLIRTFQRQEVENQRPRQLVTLREGGLDDSQETELLERIIQQERSRQGISEPTDG